MKTLFTKTILSSSIRSLIIGSSAAALLLGTGPSHAVEVEVSGYVKADFIFDVDQDLGDTLAATAVAVGDVASETSFRSHVKQSRFRITFEDEETEVNGRIEVDLFTSDGNELVSNSRHLRLRHAFINYKSLLFGQTWSNYMDRDFIAYPTTVDFGGPAGPAFVRQTQIRYTNGDFSVALENAESRIKDETTRDSIPDITARYANSGEIISWFASGVVSNYEVAGGVNNGDSTSNVGGQFGASFGFDGGDVFGLVAANGGRYTYYGWANPQAVVRAGNLETVDHTAASLGVHLGPVTLVYGTITFDDEFEAELGSTAPEELTTLHANYMWSPDENLNFGVELSNAKRKDFSGIDGDATRLQFMAQYSF